MGATCGRCGGALRTGEVCWCRSGGSVRALPAPAPEDLSWLACGECGGQLENVTDICFCQKHRAGRPLPPLPLALTTVQSNSRPADAAGLESERAAYQVQFPSRPRLVTIWS